MVRLHPRPSVTSSDHFHSGIACLLYHGVGRTVVRNYRYTHSTGTVQAWRSGDDDFSLAFVSQPFALVGAWGITRPVLTRGDSSRDAWGDLYKHHESAMLEVTDSTDTSPSVLEQ